MSKIRDFTPKSWALRMTPQGIVGYDFVCMGGGRKFDLFSKTEKGGYLS